VLGDPSACGSQRLSKFCTVTGFLRDPAHPLCPTHRSGAVHLEDAARLQLLDSCRPGDHHLSSRVGTSDRRVEHTDDLDP